MRRQDGGSLRYWRVSVRVPLSVTGGTQDVLVVQVPSSVVAVKDVTVTERAQPGAKYWRNTSTSSRNPKDSSAVVPVAVPVHRSGQVDLGGRPESDQDGGHRHRPVSGHHGAGLSERRGDGVGHDEGARGRPCPGAAEGDRLGLGLGFRRGGGARVLAGRRQQGAAQNERQTEVVALDHDSVRSLPGVDPLAGGAFRVLATVHRLDGRCATFRLRGASAVAELD